MSTTTATNTIKDSAITDIAAGLNQLVADSYGLMAQLHLAHWNVEGADFYPLHTGFQTQYEELFTAIDDIAERVRALDCYSAGGLKTLASMSNIEEGPSASGCPAKDFVASVLVGHEKVIETAHKTRLLAAESGDAETEDLLIGRISTHQKFAWMLRSYLK
ncbi:MAG: DNA starvation/stationary phase protection protein [Verrucomicrobiales bacterium]|nr:DNA starvation/stationary phase protection protein [Verrucomicrobiales bacterium]